MSQHPQVWAASIEFEMRTTLLSILVWFVLALAACKTAPTPLDNAQRPLSTGAAAHALDAIPEPDNDAITRIRTPEEWHNPYVIVDSVGYELILYGHPRTTERLTLARLEEALLNLPPEQWPIGRVVAVQESGIRSNGDDPKIRSNLQTLKKMLESNEVRVNLWPAA